MLSIRDNLSALMSTRHLGNRFARHLEKNLQLGEWGGSKMLSIRLDPIDSRRFVCLDVDPSPWKSICCMGGLRMLSIRDDLSALMLTRHPRTKQF